VSKKVEEEVYVRLESDGELREEDRGCGGRPRIYRKTEDV
jgi:hypothetical protein